MAKQTAALLRAQVEVSQCVHYCAFRYGQNAYHPYESYIRRLYRGDPLDEIRAEFVGFLRRFRPRHLGELLGVTLARRYPLWLFPWSRLGTMLRMHGGAGWHARPQDVPDVITHFSDAGISKARIELEYGWLHGAYDSIVRHGYQPERYGCPRVQLLEHEDGRRAALVLDGNHRIATLAALGVTSLVVEYDPTDTIHRRQWRRWWGVRLRRFTPDDACRVFDAYFDGHQLLPTTGVAMPAIVD